MLTMILKAVNPQVLQVDKIRTQMLNALRAEGREHQKILQETVKTWKAERPKFESSIHLSRKEGAAVETKPTGSEQGVNKWHWLDGGTRVRYATMSKDWHSKTFPGWLGSGPGRGKRLFVSKRRPRPGIKARRWSLELAKKRQQPFGHAIARAVGGPYFLGGYRVTPGR